MLLAHLNDMLVGVRIILVHPQVVIKLIVRRVIDLLDTETLNILGAVTAGHRELEYIIE